MRDNDLTPSSPAPAPDDAMERAAQALTLPLLAQAGAILGAVALVCGLASSMAPAPRPPALIFPVERTEQLERAEQPRTLATSITPITSTGGGASGIVLGSYDRYDVTCTVTSTVTLYPAVHDGTAWQVFQAYGCALDASVSTKGSCSFPAKRGAGLTFNAFKVGAGSVASCTAEGVVGAPPLSRPPPPSSGAGSGTITGVTAGTGLTGGGSSGSVSLALTTPVTAPTGGTGFTSYTAGDLIYASGTTTLAKRGIGSEGTVLTVVSGTPAWAAAASALPTDYSARSSAAGGFGTDYYPIWFSQTPASTFTNAHWIYAPAGSKWRVGVATESAVNSGDTLTVAIRSNTSWVGGSAADESGSSVVQTPSDPTTTMKWGSTITLGADKWIAIRANYSGGSIPVGWMYYDLQRVP